jgi:hypothetical protein
MRQRNPDKGLKLIKDAATEDSSAKYLLAMLKYRCNRADPEAIPKHFEPGPQARPGTGPARARPAHEPYWTAREKFVWPEPDPKCYF